jgi:hypothetical protein
MEESLKYFQPEIEDIRIGYECEVNALAIDKIKDEWVITKIKRGSQINGAEEALRLHYLRTLYLTKEQIEKEGWKETISHGVYEKDGFKLGYLWNGECPPMIHISCLNSIKYQGECKSVNELRYITKLLHI